MQKVYALCAFQGLGSLEVPGWIAVCNSLTFNLSLAGKRARDRYELSNASVHEWDIKIRLTGDILQHIEFKWFSRVASSGTVSSSIGWY